jgi:hypothetical protein
VVVTSNSVCALTRSYAREASDADALCKKRALAAAGDKEKWPNVPQPGRREDGSGPGKSFTTAQGAQLRLFSTRL